MFEFLGEVAGVAGAVLTGGASGLLGTAVSAATKFFQRRQAHRHEVELRKLDMEHARIEAAGFERAAAVEVEGERERAAWSALEASYREAATRWSRGDSPWLVSVDVVRGLTRPVLTFMFVGITATIYFTLATQYEGVRWAIIHTVLYLTMTTVVWWFGARQLDKPPKPAARS